MLALLRTGLLLGMTATPATAAPVTATHAQVWVAGRQVEFSHLGLTFGDPVAATSDNGLRTMLDDVAARMAWQPGTRFVAVTRADGQLITFTVGSNAVFVNGAATAIPFAPFAREGDIYLPLLPLARALGLGVRGFRGGYVFVPQILSVTARRDGPRTIVHIASSAHITWHSAYGARAAARTLTLSFPGFGTDLSGDLGLRGKAVLGATISESGPPGYPTTAVAIALDGKAKFAAHRSADGVSVDVVVARGDAALHMIESPATPNAVTRVTGSTNQPTPRATVIYIPPAPPIVLKMATPTPGPTVLEGVTAVPSGPVPAVSSAVEPEPVDTSSAGPVATAQPMPAASPSSAPEPMVDQKITNISVAQVPTGTRITLTFAGPVSFEWHRLGDPDDRFWLDIAHAVLSGPAQALDTKLDFIKSVKISQHFLTPDKVVRISIAPTRETDIRVGQIAGTSNQIGIEIETAPPAPDAAMTGTGVITGTVAIQPSSRPATPVPTAPTQGDLIVLDAGHGGNDPGALNTELGLTEKNLALTISKLVQNRLQASGWRVIMTRDGDYEVGDPNGVAKQELQARCDVANAVGASAFVSIHINSSVSTVPNGTTTYYWRAGDRQFAQDVQSATVAADGIVDAGVKREDFYVIKHTSMPAVLVETAYLSNAHDGAMLQQPAFLDRVAAGIVKGIMDFTGGPKPMHASPGPSP